MIKSKKMTAIAVIFLYSYFYIHTINFNNLNSSSKDETLDKVQEKVLGYFDERQDFIKALRSSPFKVLALGSALHAFILSC